VKLKHTEFFYAPDELGMSIIVCLEFVVSPVVGLLEIFRFVLIFRKVFAEEGKHNYELRGLQQGFTKWECKYHVVFRSERDPNQPF